MSYDPENYHRRSIRLQGYDYSQNGAYFVTACTQNRECFFGHIADGKMVLNDAGRMLWAVCDELPMRFSDMELDEFIVMPNHIHGIIVLCRRGESCIRPISLSFPGKLWQRNYYEHIISNENKLNRIREYIIENPLKWELDRKNSIARTRPAVSQQDEPWQI